MHLVLLNLSLWIIHQFLQLIALSRHFGALMLLSFLLFGQDL